MLKHIIEPFYLKHDVCVKCHWFNISIFVIIYHSYFNLFNYFFVLSIVRCCVVVLARLCVSSSRILCCLFSLPSFQNIYLIQSNPLSCSPFIPSVLFKAKFFRCPD